MSSSESPPSLNWTEYGVILVHSCGGIYHYQDLLLCLLVPIHTEAAGGLPENTSQCPDRHCWGTGLPSPDVWETGRWSVHRRGLSAATCSLPLPSRHATTVWRCFKRGGAEAAPLQWVHWWSCCFCEQRGHGLHQHQRSSASLHTLSPQTCPSHMSTIRDTCPSACCCPTESVLVLPGPDVPFHACCLKEDGGFKLWVCCIRCSACVVWPLVQ